MLKNNYFKKMVFYRELSMHLSHLKVTENICQKDILFDTVY